MRLLLTATCLTPVALLVTTAARADTTIATATTANVSTATAASGSPDNIVISSAGSITPASGTAVTLNSNNTVSNAGTISFTGIDNAVGIGASGGTAGSIANTGTITNTESYAATDTNSDGVVDGPFAQGTGRYGIRVQGTAPFVGTISNSGTITVKGNNSAGISVEAPLTGTFTHSGTITVTGDNSAGISLGPVSGSVVITGSSSATGAGAVGVALNGDVGGAVVLHGGINATGYSSTTLPSSTASLGADNLLQGGVGLSIGGNVAGGVLIAAAPTDTTNTTIDADGDGIADAGEGTGTIVTFSGSPALQIGSSTQAITLGAVTGTSTGLVVRGSLTATGVYSGVASTGIRIGGLGQAVTVTGGMGVSGTVAATANGADATAIRIGAGATVATLTNTGSITAAVNTADTGSAFAIAIDSGATVNAITNALTISATPATTASGNATAIRDASGTLASVGNTGTISATGMNGRAIDAQANTGGFTYTQALASATATAPTLVGAIMTGSGNDVIAASAGTLNSAISLGTGDDSLALSGTAALSGSVAFGNGTNRLALAGTSSFTGNADFGGGAGTFTIGDTAAFSGQLLNAGGTNVAVQGGTLSLTNSGAVPVAGLTLAGGTIGATIDPASGTHTELDVSGATVITGAPTVALKVSSFGAGGSYTVLRSGTLSGSGGLTLNTTTLPYLLTASVAGNDAAGTVAVTIDRKTAAQMSFTRSEAAAYDAVYADIAGNPTLSTLYLGLTDKDATLRRYRQMLPDHAGGVFDVLYTGTRTLAPSESIAPWTQIGGLSLWAQQGYWGAHQDADDTPGYHGSGYGFTGGGDVPIGALGRIGVSLGYIHADVKDASENSVIAHEFQGGVYYTGVWGGFHLAASGQAGFVALNSDRYLSSTSDNVPTLLSADGNWHGLMLSGSARASYEAHLGALYLRPAGTISYYRLHENAHDETGGGTGFDLSIDSRTSDELAATGTMALGVQFGGTADPDSINFRLEVEGGRRQVLSNAIGATTARFSGGDDFTLLPEDRDSGYIGAVNLSIGSANFRFLASASGEKRSGYNVVLGRVGVRGVF